jgi:hypothetical protein
MGSLDIPLLRQMIVNRAVGFDDLMERFHLLLSQVKDLMSPARTERLVAFEKCFIECCRRLIDSGAGKGRSEFQSIVPILPLFFEVSMAFVDELQRDVITLRPFINSFIH